MSSYMIQNTGSVVFVVKYINDEPDSEGAHPTHAVEVPPGGARDFTSCKILSIEDVPAIEQG